jgi:adenine deaminase
VPRDVPPPEWDKLRLARSELADVALGQAYADLAVVGGQLVDVNAGQVRQAGIAVRGNRIASVGEVDTSIGPDTEIVDARGLLITPGLVAPHFHQWHSNHNPAVVAGCMLERGVTAVADGFYGPAIVGGIEAVRLLADAFLRTPLKLILLAPTHAYAQNRAAGLPPAPRSPSAQDLLAMLEWPDCRGLEETFYDLLCEPAVRDFELMQVVERALELGKVATGHGVGPETAAEIAAWAACGITNDHEAVDVAMVETEVQAGLHVLLRDAPGFPNVRTTLPAIMKGGLPLDRFQLCPDVAWADTIFEAHFDETVREAIRCGLDPVSAIRLATVFPARFFRVDHEIGSVAPGRFADFVLVEDLEAFRVASVYVNGEKFQGEVFTPEWPSWALRTMRVPRVPRAEELRVNAPFTEGTAQTRVIEINDGEYLSREVIEELPVREGVVQTREGVNKVALLERLDSSGDYGVGFVKGFGLRVGAMASASNPLTQAVVGVAASDAELAAALRAVVESEGAFVAVRGERPIAVFPTPLFGTASELAYEPAREAVRALVSAWRGLGCTLSVPFAYLEFVAATSEPYLRISTQGVVRIDPSSRPRVQAVDVIAHG